MALTFIAATGTDIGKTYITCLLIKTASKMGKTVRGVKPVISGFDENKINESDTGHILEAMGQSLTMEKVREISPWRFSAALSPDMAARREGTAIPLLPLVDFCNKQDSDTPTLVEGVGGVMVPLNETDTTLDWQSALNAKCFLVTGSYLGTLSHTMTALEALKERGITPSAIIINSSESAPVPEQETAETLSRFVTDIPIHIVPRNAETLPGELVLTL